MCKKIEREIYMMKTWVTYLFSKNKRKHTKSIDTLLIKFKWSCGAKLSAYCKYENGLYFFFLNGNGFLLWQLQWNHAILNNVAWHLIRVWAREWVGYKSAKCQVQVQILFYTRDQTHKNVNSRLDDIFEHIQFSRIFDAFF